MRLVSTTNPLRALAADLARPGDRPRVPADEELSWLLVTIEVRAIATSSVPARLQTVAAAAASLDTFGRLQQASGSPGGASLREIARAIELLDHDRGVALYRAVRRIARRMFDAGCPSLPYRLLALLRQVAPSAPGRERALALIDQAVLAQQAGESIVADDHLSVAWDLTRGTHPDVVVRVLSARAGLTGSERGTPRAQKLFMEALARAEASLLTEHLVPAHTSLMLVAGQQGDLGTALEHGRCAAELARDQRGRAQVLGNLAHLALLAGYPRAALCGALEVLRSDAVDAHLAAIGTVATAAAELGDDERVAWAYAELTRRNGHRLESQAAIAAAYAVSDALRRVGEYDSADDIQARIHAIARERGYFEWFEKTHPERTPLPPTAARPIPLAPASVGAIAYLEAFAPALS